MEEDTAWQKILGTDLQRAPSNSTRDNRAPVKVYQARKDVWSINFHLVSMFREAAKTAPHLTSRTCFIYLFSHKFWTPLTNLLIRWITRRIVNRRDQFTRGGLLNIISPVLRRESERGERTNWSRLLTDQWAAKKKREVDHQPPPSKEVPLCSEWKVNSVSPVQSLNRRFK